MPQTVSFRPSPPRTGSTSHLHHQPAAPPVGVMLATSVRIRQSCDKTTCATQGTWPNYAPAGLRLFPGLCRVNEKSCLVTGAASGIGKATALLLARSGARVTAADIDGPGVGRLRTELAAEGIGVIVVTGDVADPRANRAMVEAAVEAYGRLDVAVANAGALPLSDVNETSPEDWDHVMAVDGRGAF
ncbi:SDR family oxidoreductase [Streptomyces vinaceus]|uniref:SDR family oxidoreductase n=1 Tax=Streptomyces vinaceus TaxID=1960 RepID=A0A5J6JQP5_STRVI|nr:SDR family oxidoreductase [Streptomyces vinaceus]